ncbi:MAG: glycosyltransferase family 2 protein [Xenococcaceae cyanobacterium MO_167.B27]|nr:glycosyltransferase family 2 protein [Xenococcaceae cyanobacterium MO_167.B27]
MAQMFWIDRMNANDVAFPNRLESQLNYVLKQEVLQSEENCSKTNPKLPLISVITVVYNAEKYIEKTILSVLQQSYKNYEYIIIDGGSTDGTVELIKKYEKNLTTWVSEPDAGIYDAMNKGIKLAQGEIIGIINSGDTYTENSLETIATLYQKHPQQNKYVVLSGAMYRFDDSKKIQFKLVKSQQDLDSRINYGMPINHPATFVTKDTYKLLNYFNTDYRICGDYDLIYRAYHNQKINFIFTSEVLAYMELGGISEQFSTIGTRCKEHFAIKKNYLPWYYNLFLSSSWLVKAITKHIIKSIIGTKLLSFYYDLRHSSNPPNP